MDIFQNTTENNLIPGAGPTYFFFNGNSRGHDGSHHNGNPYIIFDPTQAGIFSANSWFSMLGKQGRRSPAEILFHEAGHAFHYFSNLNLWALNSFNRPNRVYKTEEEKRTILEIENKAAAVLYGDNFVPRKRHSGVSYYPVSSVIKTQ